MSVEVPPKSFALGEVPGAVPDLNDPSSICAAPPRVEMGGIATARSRQKGLFASLRGAAV